MTDSQETGTFTPLAALKVRPYNDEERRRTAFNPPETPDQKRRRKVAGFFIDAMRYRDAVGVHPEMAEHLNRVLAASFSTVREYVGVEDQSVPFTGDSLEAEELARLAQISKDMGDEGSPLLEHRIVIGLGTPEFEAAVAMHSFHNMASSRN